MDKNRNRPSTRKDGGYLGRLLANELSKSIQEEIDKELISKMMDSIEKYAEESPSWNDT